MKYSLHESKARKGTLVIESHNMVELSSICDDGICLDMGHVAHAGPIRNVIEAYKGLIAAAANNRAAVAA